MTKLLGTVRKDLNTRDITPTEREWMDIVGDRIHLTTELRFTDEDGIEHKLWFHGRTPAAKLVWRTDN